MLSRSGAHDCRLHLFTDNMTVFHALRKYHTRSESFRVPLRRCVEWQISHNVDMTVQWLSSADNAAADYESRHAGDVGVTRTYGVPAVADARDRSDVMLHSRLFEMAQTWSGMRCTVDICASIDNRQTRRFIALGTTGCEDQVGVDCLATDLGCQSLDGGAADRREVVWCNPPWAILSPLLAHLRASGARGLVVFPESTAQWFRALTHECRRVAVLADAGDKLVFWERCSATGTMGEAPRTAMRASATRLFVAAFDFNVSIVPGQ
jgi:hypothetical protein